jgi:hypothetical protein
MLSSTLIKEGTKVAFGCARAVISAYAIRDLARNSPSFNEKTLSQKVATVAAYTVLSLSLVSSYPVRALTSRAATALGVERNLIAIFGPPATFVSNPWHPKHVISLTAYAGSLLFMITSLVNRGFAQVQWNSSLSQRTVMVIGVNVVLSRPMLHIGNALFRQLIL